MKKIWLLALISAFTVDYSPSFGTVEFKTHVVSSFSTMFPRNISIGDIDGDGDFDFAVPESGTSKIAIYENNGATSPNFTKYQVGPNQRTPTHVQMGDFDGDNMLDLAFAAVNSSKVCYYINGGGPLADFNANLTEVIVTEDPDLNNTVFEGFALKNRMVSIGDIDGDGDLDLTSSSVNNDRIAWYENLGNDQWFPHALTDSLDGARAVHVADVDDDGDQDVIGGGWFDNDGIVWFENDGNSEPVFTEHVLATFPDNPNPFPNVEEEDGSEGGQEDGMLWRIESADMDNDGDTDVIAARRTNGAVEWYENDGGSTPSFQRHTILFGAGLEGKSVYPADFDADGHMDIAFASRTGDLISWYRNDGAADPNFEEVIVHTDPDGVSNPQQGFVDGARSVFAADIDNDGDMDFAWVALLAGLVGWEENLIIQRHADCDRDGDVDGDDLAIWESGYGVDAMGDTDGDGDTDSNDFLTWQRQFTGSLPAIAPAATSVPEPSSIVLMGMAMMLVSRQRR